VMQLRESGCKHFFCAQELFYRNQSPETSKHLHHYWRINASQQVVCICRRFEGIERQGRGSASSNYLHHYWHIYASQQGVVHMQRGNG
jgi:hypothetical protein